jgi:trans-aconitate 2-methyltransferase
MDRGSKKFRGLILASPLAFSLELAGEKRNFPRMATWDSAQYLKFAEDRTRPSIDLAASVALEAPLRAIDLGCGPGNSTAVVGRRWPSATVTGLDSSPAMLATAQQEHPEMSWIKSDIASWAATNTEKFDLIFSNAALHWVPNHAKVLPEIFSAVAGGGALAFQVPHSLADPHQTCMRALPFSPKWRPQFTQLPVIWQVEPVGFYYELFTARATRVDLWLTDYIYVFDGPAGIVEWHRGAALRPFLELLPDEAAREEFLADYLAAITPHYPRQSNGKVLLPFRRLFVIAYR